MDTSPSFIQDVVDDEDRRRLQPVYELLADLDRETITPSKCYLRIYELLHPNQ